MPLHSSLGCSIVCRDERESETIKFEGCCLKQSSRNADEHENPLGTHSPPWESLAPFPERTNSGPGTLSPCTARAETVGCRGTQCVG